MDEENILHCRNVSKSNGKIVNRGKIENVPAAVLWSYIMVSFLSVPFLPEIRKHSCGIYRLVFVGVFFVHPSEFSKSVTTVRLYNVKLSEVVHKYQLHVLYCRNNDNGWSCCAINREKVTFLKSFNRPIWYVYVFLWIFFKIYLWKKQNHTIVSCVWSIDWLIYCWLTSVNEYFIYSNYTVRMVALRFTFWWQIRIVHRLYAEVIANITKLDCKRKYVYSPIWKSIWSYIGNKLILRARAVT